MSNNGWLQYSQLFLSILGVIVLPVIWKLWSLMTKMRENDMRHIEEGLNRIEVKIDNHITWHLGGK